MTDKEKIKKEIERLNHLVPYDRKDRHDDGLHDAYFKMLQFIDSLPEESVSENLEEAARKECNGLTEKMEIINTYCEFIRGAKWQKEQMLKDVVLETTIIRDDDGCAEDYNYESWLEYEDNEIFQLPTWAEEGDKVKVIIIKEDKL